jgi:hypothetical protein
LEFRKLREDLILVSSIPVHGASASAYPSCKAEPIMTGLVQQQAVMLFSPALGWIREDPILASVLIKALGCVREHSILADVSTL